MMSDTVRSLSLKAKLEAVARQDLVTWQDSQYEKSATSSALSLQHKTSARVWQTMQNSLRTPATGKKLKSLRQSLEATPTDQSRGLPESEAPECLGYTASLGLFQGNWIFFAQEIL